MDRKPFITRRHNGEYSTVQIGDIIETCWFGHDGQSEVIGRTFVSLATVAERHIQEYERRDDV